MFRFSSATGQFGRSRKVGAVGQPDQPARTAKCTDRGLSGKRRSGRLRVPAEGWTSRSGDRRAATPCRRVSATVSSTELAALPFFSATTPQCRRHLSACVPTDRTRRGRLERRPAFSASPDSQLERPKVGGGRLPRGEPFLSTHSRRPSRNRPIRPVRQGQPSCCKRNADPAAADRSLGPNAPQFRRVEFGVLTVRS